MTAVPSMSPGNTQIYDYIIDHSGPDGMSVAEIARGLAITPQAVYRHIHKLVSLGRLSRPAPGRYLPAHGASSHHVLPGLGDIQAGTVAQYLDAYRQVTDLNDTMIVKTVKSFPWWLSRLADFGRRWHEGSHQYRPSRDEVNTVREGLTQVSARAFHLHKMAESVLNNEALWHHVKGPMLWYNEPGYPVTDDMIVDWCDHVFKLVNGTNASKP